jgi:hypothetical protein
MVMIIMVVVVMATSCMEWNAEDTVYDHSLWSFFFHEIKGIRNVLLKELANCSNA